MKKICSIIALFLTFVMLLVSCEMPFISNTDSTPTTNNLPSSTTVKPSGSHDDNDADSICDNCGGMFVNSKCIYKPKRYK